MTEPHHQACIVLTPELLGGVLGIVLGSEPVSVGNRTYRTAGGVPSGALGLRAGITSSGSVRLVLEHESFPLVVEGGCLTQLSPQVSVETKSETERAAVENG